MCIRIMLHRLSGLLVGSFLVIVLSSANFPPVVHAQAHSQAQLRQFDFITATSGWILMDQELFRTTDAGKTWNEITPELPSGAAVQVVDFTDANMGWVLCTTIASDGSSLFSLSATSDHGVTWTTLPLFFFESGEPAAYAEKAQMDWFDSQTGWIAVKQSSGSNFSLGTLFTTSDGGASWTRSALPVADRVHFAEAGFGWAGGGPSGDQLFETQDGGSTWREVSPGHPQNGIITTYVPFYSNDDGVLVTTQLADENFLNVFEYQSGQWSLFDRAALSVQPGILGLSILDGQNFVAVIPGTRSIVRLENGELRSLENADGLSASIVDLDMLTLEAGWAKSILSDCSDASILDDEPASVSCASSTRLLYTEDGGVTWQVILLPLVEDSVFSPEILNSAGAETMEVLPNLGNSQVFIGQGFDKCELPTASQLQTWWNNSPYKTVNLYIGGSNRACDNLPLSATHLKTIHQQGWKFIPTWVGPQAPCTGYLYRFSSDTTIAYNQGVAEADLAVERLVELGLTYPDKTGSVIYYDIENYGTNTACRSAVNAFMNGWVSQIRARGNLAGVYGSTLCNTGLSDFLNITNVPDVIWPARWYHNQGQGYYDPDASVWNLGSCIPNTVWADHQRIRQYEGDHFETWGNLTLGIDSNVLDGVVAVPYLLPFVKSTTRANPNPSVLDTVTFNIQFSSAVTGVDAGDFTLATTGVVGANIENVSGSGQTYSVVVSTGTGNGTIRLNVMDDDSIVDITGTPLGGAGSGNGNFTSGEVYDVFESVTFTSLSTSTEDGWILESTETSAVGGKLNKGGRLFRLGDDAANRQYRAILSFDTPILPEGAVIASVTLKFKHAGIFGTDPFSTHGKLLADICMGPFSGEPALELSDFRTACSKKKALIFTSSKLDNWYSQSLKPVDFQYINLGGLTQFRLRFATDDNNDFGADFLKLHSGNALVEADRPQLVITYYVP